MKQEKMRLYGAVAAAVVIASIGGFGLAKLADGKSLPAVSDDKSGKHEEAPHDVVEMEPQAVQAAQITVAPATAGGLAGEVLAQATAVASPSGQAVLTARAAGAVTRINKRIGDPVRAGETLAVVESREAAQIAAERASASARATLAQKNLAREQRLYEERVSPRQDYEQAQAEAAAANAEARRAHAAAGAAKVTADGRGVTVASPISGRITAASASLGAYVQPETELFRVADPSRIQIEASVSGADASRVSVGDRVIVEATDGRTLQGRVRSITPGLNLETGAATAVVDAPTSSLQPGQTLRVRIITARLGATAIIVAEEAVQTVGGRDVVFVRSPKGFQARPVTVGQRGAGRVEIVNGLSAGQSVATRNAFLLKAELSKGEGGDEH
jgi:cobalt-zinc-cadmium efflux system membrane fusion protein